jgi:hypothetical protein
MNISFLQHVGEAALTRLTFAFVGAMAERLLGLSVMNNIAQSIIDQMIERCQEDAEAAKMLMGPLSELMGTDTKELVNESVNLLRELRKAYE